MVLVQVARVQLMVLVQVARVYLMVFVQVARVQLMVLEAASNIPSAKASISRLNSDLLDITTLYQVGGATKRT